MRGHSLQLPLGELVVALDYQVLGAVDGDVPCHRVAVQRVGPHRLGVARVRAAAAASANYKNSQQKQQQQCHALLSIFVLRSLFL